MLQGLRGIALREQDLAEQIARVGEVRLRLERSAQERERLLRPPQEVEDGGEGVLRLGVAGACLQLRAEGLLRLRQPALLQ